MWAMTVMASGAPRRARNRRNLAPQVGLTAPQTGGGHAEGGGRTVLDMPGASAEHLASGNLIVRTQTQEGRKVGLAGKPAHIDTHLGDDGLCVHDIDAIDLSQVRAADAV